MLFLNSTTNYQLTNDVSLPNRAIVLSKMGSLHLGTVEPEGITGRINIPNSRFYLSFYFDAGGGSVPFTWQIYAGVAWQPKDWVDVLIGYRHLSFQNGSKTSGVGNLDLCGVLPAANFHL